MASADGTSGRESLLELVDSRKEHTYGIAMRAITLLVEQVQRDLPDLGREALRHARQVWFHGVAATELVASRIACWGYLDKKNGNSTSIVDREDHAVRALLCCLFAENEDSDPYEGVAFGLDMLDALGVVDAEIGAAVMAASA